MPEHPPPALYVVTVSGARDELAEALVSVPHARVVRALDEHRLVVSVSSPSDVSRLAELPGVTAVHPDRLEHPTRRESRS